MPSGYGISFGGYGPGVSNRFGIVPSGKFGTNRFSGTLRMIVAKQRA
jgi:hypothetical protein